MARILKEITIGWDITNTERAKVQDTIAEFTDCFALSIKEVNAILGATHKLNIPEGATFRMKILLRSYNPDQRVFMEAKINEMLEAGIICSIHPKDVRFVAQTVLVQKAHKGDGLTIKELKHQVNDQCTKHGLPSNLRCHHDQNQWNLRKKRNKMNQRNGVCAKTLEKSTGLQKSHQYHKETYVQNNYVFQATAIYISSILQQGSTEWKYIQSLDHTSHSMWRAAVTSHTNTCPLVSQEGHLNSGTLQQKDSMI